MIFTLIEIFVVLGILDQSQYLTEGKILAGLIVIYATIRSLGIGLGMTIDKLSLAFAGELISIKEMIGKSYDSQYERESLNEATTKVNTSNVKLIIRSVGVLIIYIAGLLALMS